MLRILFQDREWLYAADTIEEGGPITTSEAYTHGKASYAHLYPSGNIQRFGSVIGSRDQVTVLGECSDPEMSVGEMLGAIANVLTDPSWDPNGHKGE